MWEGQGGRWDGWPRGGCWWWTRWVRPCRVQGWDVRFVGVGVVGWWVECIGGWGWYLPVGMNVYTARKSVDNVRVKNSSKESNRIE